MRHTPPITVQGRLSSSSKPVLIQSSDPSSTGASRRIHKYLPSRLIDGAATADVHRQKPIASAAMGMTGSAPPSRPINSRRSFCITSAAAPMATSIIRPMPAFQKYMGVPKNRLASLASRAFFCPEADWADSL